MKLKGAFWPELRKVASAKLQLDLGCNPHVASVFHPTMQITALPASIPVYVHEGTAQEWEELAGEWEHDNIVSPVIDMGLDQVYLH